MKITILIIACIVFSPCFCTNTDKETIAKIADIKGPLELAMEDVEKTVMRMKGAKRLPSERHGSAESIPKQFKIIKVLAREVDATLKPGTEEYKKAAALNAKHGGSYQARSDAVKGITTGSQKLVKGINSGEWTEIGSGGLDIVSNLSALGQSDTAKILTSVLKILSAVFGIVGSSTGSTESTGGMLKKVIEQALLDDKSDQLRAEFFGVKRLYESLSNSIRAFRDSENELDSNNGEDDPPEERMSDEIVNEIYAHAFSGVQLFGTIESKLEKWCVIGDFDEEKKVELEKKANLCLEFANLYAECSVVRHLLLADMASLLGQLGKDPLAKSLLKLMTQEQESDKNIFRFLAQPINFRLQRYVIALFYSGIERFPTLSAYLMALNIDLPTEETIETDATVSADVKRPFIASSVMACDEKMLGGDCYSESENIKINDLAAWNKINSIYISADKKLYGYANTNQGGQQYGPFYGPAVFGNIADEAQFKFSSAKIERGEKNARTFLRVCEKESLEVKSRCAMFDYGIYPDLATPFKDITNRPTGPSWKNKVGSMSIPSGMMVTGYQAISNGGDVFGPFYGPQVVNIVCKGDKWLSMKIEKIEKYSTEMIKICRKEGLKGYCDHIDADEVEMFENTSAEKPHHGCEWNDANSIKSMKIPGGFEINIFRGEGKTGQIFGPYTGPATINRIDGAFVDDGAGDVTKPYIKSIEIKKLYGELF